MGKIERKLAEFTLEDFSKAEYYCWKADRDFQVADSKFESLKEHGKDLLAVLMTEKKNLVPGHKVSEAELERHARSSEKWRVHRDGEHAARTARNELKFKSRAAQRYWETIQSGLSYIKAEMSRGISQSG